MEDLPSSATLSRSGTSLIDGHNLYWELHGPSEGPCVTLLHHGLGSVRAWRRQIPAFVEAGWVVLAYDRWGYGQSDARPGFEKYFLRHDTEESIQVLDALGIEKTALVGHSDGGSIAIMLAASHPERIVSMAIVAAHIYSEPKMRVGLLSIQEDARHPPLHTALQRDHGERAESLVEDWIDHWRGIDGFELKANLADITCPTLVIQGALDEHATPQHARDIAKRISHSELWLIPQVHHMPPHEIPDEFNRRVLEFLEEHR